MKFTYAKLLKVHKQLKANQIEFETEDLLGRVRVMLALGWPIVTVHLWSEEERREVRGLLTGVELGRVKFVVTPFTFKPAI